MMKNAVFVLLACCTTAVFAAWPTYHGEADLKGVSDAALPDQMELLWRYNAGGEIHNPPVSDGEHIFFSTTQGRIISLALDGSECWTRTFTRSNDAGSEVKVRFEAPLACAGGLVFAGTTQGTLYALDAGTGAGKWSFQTGGIIVGSPNFVRTAGAADPAHVVVLDQNEGSLHGLDLPTGEQRWKTEGVERCDGSPGAAGGRIAFGSCLAALHVYSAGGKHLNDIEVGGDGQIAGGVAIDGHLAFAGTRDGSLVCADMETGEVVWSSDESEEETFSTPAVTAGRVIYSSDNGFVYAVHKKDASLLWKFDTDGLPGSPVAAQDAVAVSGDGVLFVLDLTDGRKLWSKEISDELTSPAMIGGMLVVGADDGTVSAFGKKE